MSVHMKQLTPNIMVENVNETLAFYTEVLGFEVTGAAPADRTEYDWGRAKRDNVEIMFQTRASLSAELPLFSGAAIGGSLNFYIIVDNVEELFKRIQGKVKIAQEMLTTFYGTKEFAILDNNGFVLSFAEQIS